MLQRAHVLAPQAVTGHPPLLAVDLGADVVHMTTRFVAQLLGIGPDGGGASDFRGFHKVGGSGRLSCWVSSQIGRFRLMDKR